MFKGFHYIVTMSLLRHVIIIIKYFEASFTDIFNVEYRVHFIKTIDT